MRIEKATDLNSRLYTFCAEYEENGNDQIIPKAVSPLTMDQMIKQYIKPYFAFQKRDILAYETKAFMMLRKERFFYSSLELLPDAARYLPTELRASLTEKTKDYYVFEQGELIFLLHQALTKRHYFKEEINKEKGDFEKTLRSKALQTSVDSSSTI